MWTRHWIVDVAGRLEAHAGDQGIQVGEIEVGDRGEALAVDRCRDHVALLIDEAHTQRLAQTNAAFVGGGAAKADNDFVEWSR